MVLTRSCRQIEIPGLLSANRLKMTHLRHRRRRKVQVRYPLTFTSRQGSFTMFFNCVTTPAFLNFAIRPDAPRQDGLARFTTNQMEAALRPLSLLCKNLSTYGRLQPFPILWSSRSITASLWTSLPLATLLSTNIPCTTHTQNQRLSDEFMRKKWEETLHYHFHRDLLTWIPISTVDAHSNCLPTASNIMLPSANTYWMESKLPSVRLRTSARACSWTEGSGSARKVQYKML